MRRERKQVSLLLVFWLSKHEAHKWPTNRNSNWWWWKMCWISRTEHQHKRKTSSQRFDVLSSCSWKRIDAKQREILLNFGTKRCANQQQKRDPTRRERRDEAGSRREMLNLFAWYSTAKIFTNRQQKNETGDVCLSERIHRRWRRRAKINWHGQDERRHSCPFERTWKEFHQWRLHCSDRTMRY